MKISAFRIRSFRSIVDSGWVKLSPDGITAFVGQNESGKSSILEALSFALNDEDPSVDDFRVEAETCDVSLRVSMTVEDVERSVLLDSVAGLEGLKRHLNNNQYVDVLLIWNRGAYAKADGIQRACSLTQPELLESIETACASQVLGQAQDSADASAASADDVDSRDLSDVLAATADALWRALPLAVLFNEADGRLPSSVDIDESKKLVGGDAKAAKNFLDIAGLQVAHLLSDEPRTRQNKLARASAALTADFNDFWSQTIGRSGRLDLSCQLEFHSTGASAKAGSPYLTFWVSDGATKLYPKQRSFGVRWFLSFYLQLRAAEKAGRRVVYLLDEPGANLHAKAQADVLRLIEKLGKQSAIVLYTTHSPQLIQYEKLYRVHAVQRGDDGGEAPTSVIDAHRLGSASTDTLFPILAAMGADVSQQQVIRKHGNVLLEEISGFYYLSALWKLLGIRTEAHFIAANGVDNIETLANMFMGWGLDFVIVVDDDSQGRGAYREMKRNLYGDDDAIACRSMFRLKDAAGIEDLFSIDDFKHLVLKDAAAEIGTTNSAYVKSKRLSKPVLAHRFAQSVNSGEVSVESLSPETGERVRLLLGKIEQLLLNR